jgi:hypothetical protein
MMNKAFPGRPLTALALLMLLAPLVSGCIALGSKANRDPNFQAGYSDGCASANANGANYRTGGRVRDDALYKTSQTYRSGWGTGFAACNPRQNPGGTDPNMGGMPSQRPPGQL